VDLVQKGCRLAAALVLELIGYKVSVNTFFISTVPLIAVILWFLSSGDLLTPMDSCLPFLASTVHSLTAKDNFWLSKGHELKTGHSFTTHKEHKVLSGPDHQMRNTPCNTIQYNILLVSHYTHK